MNKHLKPVTGYRRLPLSSYESVTGYHRLHNRHPPVTGYHRLPACPILIGYRNYVTEPADISYIYIQYIYYKYIIFTLMQTPLLRECD